MKRTLHSGSVRESAPVHAKQDARSGAGVTPTEERDAFVQSEKSERSPKKIRIKSERHSASRKSVTLIPAADGFQASQAAPSGARAEPVSPRRCMQDPPSSPPAATAAPVAPCSQPEFKSAEPGLQPTLPTARPQQEQALSPDRKETGAERRGQWISREQLSFVFDEITDPAILALSSGSALATDATEPPHAPSAQLAEQLAEKARKHALANLAKEIQRALEGPLANIIRQFMQIRPQQQQDHSDYESASKAFYELMPALQLAKVAAMNGNEAEMLSQLEKAQEQIAAWIATHWKPASRQFKVEKAVKAELKNDLVELLDDCDRWRKGANAAKDNAPPLSPNSRQRSHSSPLKPGAAWSSVEAKPSQQTLLRHADATSPKSSHHRIKPTSGEASQSASPASSPVASPVSSPRAPGKHGRPASVIGIMPVSPPREPEQTKPVVKALSSSLQPRGVSSALFKPSSQNEAQTPPRKKQ